VTRDGPPAKRLVLFVADGLRADRFFELDPETKRTRAPFLRSIVETKGTWGVSHTRVPTESRPGHVAIIAGLYEDVSAVTKGWQENPVEFDSVFNASAGTWSFGSPDILPMFAKGALPGRVLTFMYDAHAEDYGKGMRSPPFACRLCPPPPPLSWMMALIRATLHPLVDATTLDTWVFDKFQDLLETAKKDPEVDAKLRQEQIVFFFHLLGLDTHGHSHRPHSEEYLRNIASVDGGIEASVKLIEDYYGHDQRTGYVFTADHGMNDRGAHGDGDPQNTETPLVAWGAGVATSRPAANTQNPAPRSVVDADRTASWGLSPLSRMDVSQADIAPLMVCLLSFVHSFSFSFSFIFFFFFWT